MDITEADLAYIIKESDFNRFRVIWNGELTVLAGEDRLFLFNRTLRQAFELKPDFEFGVTVHRL